MAVTDYSPSPSEQYQWGVRRRNNLQGWGRAQAQTNFDRGNINANRATDTRNLATQYDQMRRRLPGQYAGRGLLGSGYHAQGQQDYATARTNAYGDLAQRYQQMLGQLNLDQQGAAQNYYNTAGDINTEEAMRRAELAAQIRGIL